MEILTRWLEEHTTDMIETLRTLCRFPSVRGDAQPGCPFGKPTADALDALLDIAAGWGMKTRSFDHYAGTIQLGEGDPALGILGHLDVVPEGSGWHYPPFDVTVDGDSLYGRGTIDDKGPTVAALYAMRALAELHIPLKKGVRLIAGCGEETGSEDMAYYQQQEAFPPLLFTPDGDFPVINIEKGRLKARCFASFAPAETRRAVVRVDGGFVANAVPESATASVRGFSTAELSFAAHRLALPGVEFSFAIQPDSTVGITCTGVSAHASTPEKGCNALTALLTLLRSLPCDPCRGFDRLCGLSRLFPYPESNGSALGLRRRDELSGALTIVLSLCHYTEEELSATSDCRFPVSMTMREVATTQQNALGAAGLEMEADGCEPHHVDGNSPFMQTLLRVYEQQTGQPGHCVAIGGGTYVHDTPNGVAFGAEFPGEENHMHGADERIRIESLLKAADLYAHAIVALCGEE